LGKDKKTARGVGELKIIGYEKHDDQDGRVQIALHAEKKWRIFFVGAIFKILRQFFFFKKIASNF
jgi:hypothetical protein